MGTRITHDDEMLHTLLSEMHTDAHSVNLAAEASSAQPDNVSYSSDAPTDVDTRATDDEADNQQSSSNRNRRGVKRSRSSAYRSTTATDNTHPQNMSGDEDDSQVRRQHHNQHTRKCRARLKGKFDSVLEMMPKPAPNQEVKHKVQILDYTIQTFKDLKGELTELEKTLALRSRQHILQWVDGFARKDQDETTVLMPFLDLLCTKKGWVYAEIWRPSEREATNTDRVDQPQDMVVENYSVKESPLCSKHTAAKLRELGQEIISSKTMVRASDAQLSEALKTLRPQLTCSLSDLNGSDHCHRLASQAGLRSSLMVPVVIDGRVSRVVVFYDIRMRQPDRDTKKLASFIATSIGNAYNAAQHERRMKRDSIASVNPGRATAARGSRG